MNKTIQHAIIWAIVVGIIWYLFEISHPFIIGYLIFCLVINNEFFKILGIKELNN